MIEKEVLLGKETKSKIRRISQKLSQEKANIRKSKAKKMTKDHGYKSS